MLLTNYKINARRKVSRLCGGRPIYKYERIFIQSTDIAAISNKRDTQIYGGSGGNQLCGGQSRSRGFPTEEIARITNEILTTTPIDALQYSITEDIRPFVTG